MADSKKPRRSEAAHALLSQIADQLKRSIGKGERLALALSGGAGVLFAGLHYLYATGGVELTLLAIVLTIWAGVGRLRSLLVAGILLGVIETVTVAWSGPRWRELMVALMLLGSLLARSGGLARGRSE